MALPNRRSHSLIMAGFVVLAAFAGDSIMGLAYRNGYLLLNEAQTASGRLYGYAEAPIPRTYTSLRALDEWLWGLLSVF